MEGRQGPWRGYRRRKTRPSDTWQEVEAPKGPMPPTERPPRFESAKASPSGPDDATGVAENVSPVTEKRLERALLVCGVLYVLLLFDVVYAGAAIWLDGRFMQWIALIPDSLRAVVGLLFSLAGYRWILLVVVAVLALRTWMRASLQSAGLIVASTLTLMLFVSFTKWVVDRPRPTTFFAGTDWLPEWVFSTSQAFPSGHSATPVLVYGLAMAALWGPPGRSGLLQMPAQVPRSRWAPILLLAFLPGVGRIVWGVHWVSDVVAGWLLGIAWLAGTLLFARVMIEREESGLQEQSGEAEPMTSGPGGLMGP